MRNRKGKSVFYVLNSVLDVQWKTVKEYLASTEKVYTFSDLELVLAQTLQIVRGYP